MGPEAKSAATVVACRAGALACAVIYFPTGLVWAYGLALFALPVAALAFWLLRKAERLEIVGGLVPSRAQARLVVLVKGLLLAGMAASAAALVLTR